MGLGFFLYSSMSFTDFSQLTYIIFQSAKKKKKKVVLKRLKKKEHKHEAANLRQPRMSN